MRAKSYNSTGFRLFVALFWVVIAARLGVLLVSTNYNTAAEAICLYGALDVADAKPLYPKKTEHPYHIYVHSPVHGLVSGYVAKLAHATHLKVISIRLLSLLALFGAIALFWKFVVRHHEFSPWVYGIAVTLGLSKFADYATSARNDIFSVLCEVAILAAFCQWLEDRKPKTYGGYIALCLLSFFVRQTGVGVCLGTILFLVWQKEWRRAFLTSLGIAAGVVLLVFLGNLLTGGAMFEHMILVNVRHGLRPIDASFFDPSLYSFLGSYVIFSAVTLVGFATAPRDERTTLLRICLMTCFLTSSAVFLRPGGDVNYYFSSIFIAFYFVSFVLEQFRNRYFPSRFLVTGVFLQLLIAAIGIGLKTRSAYELGRRPYEAAAAQLKTLPAFGLLTGHHAANLAVHLRGWAYHGPDFTANSFAARHAAVGFEWVLPDIQQAIEDGTIKTVVVANDGCSNPKAAAQPLEADANFFKGTLRGFTYSRALYDWLCLYERPTFAEPRISMRGSR